MTGIAPAPQYASELVCRALGLAPSGSRVTEDSGFCVQCGRPMPAGTPGAAWKAISSFTDHIRLCAGTHSCGWCEASTAQTVMRVYQNAVVTESGVFSLSTDAARAWFWLTPPEPPFFVVVNHNLPGTFHYHWRTPVSLSKELVALTVDDTPMLVRRAKVMRALQEAAMLRDRLQSSGLVAPGKPVHLSPFTYLSRKPSREATSVRLRKEVNELAERDADCARSASFLTSLSAGEYFALSSLLKAKQEIPLAPEAITSVPGLIN